MRWPSLTWSRNSKKTIIANFTESVAELKELAKAELAKMAGFVQPNFAGVNFA